MKRLPVLTADYITALADPSYVTSRDGHVVAWNEAAERLLGWPADQAIGHLCADLLAGVDATGARICTIPCSRLAPLSTEQSAPHGDMAVRLASGARCTVSVSGLPVSYRGEPALLHVLRPAGADRDILTGALTRSVFRLRAADEQAHARRTGEPLALALVDLDGLKRINDEGSHAAGDAALMAVAACLQGRRNDRVARWGGDEFTVLLPGATPAQASGRLRRGIRTLRSRAVAPVSFSAGVTNFRAGERLDDALARCDTALHTAKASGRAAVRTLAG